MQLWSYWLETLQLALQQLSTTFGVSMGVAIVLLTLMLRLALLPVSWSVAYRGCIHQKKVKRLQPELRRLREQFGSDPEVLTRKTFKLYKDRKLSLIDGRSFLGALAQLPVFLGMFHSLRSSAEAARFLWISSLSKPDFWIAVIAGVTTALMVAANPDLPEQARMLMIVLPSVVAFLFAMNFASALAVYWVTSNLFSAIHTAAVHFVVSRRIRNGSLAV